MLCEQLIGEHNSILPYARLDARIEEGELRPEPRFADRRTHLIIPTS